MDSDSFAPSGQGPDNNMTPQDLSELNTASESAPEHNSETTSEPALEPSPESSLGSSFESNPTSESPFESNPTSESPSESNSASDLTSESPSESNPTSDLTPESSSESELVPESTQDSPSSSIPDSSTTTPEPAQDANNNYTSSSEQPRKHSNKLPIIIISCLLIVALVAVLLFLIPFNGKPFWQSITGGPASYQTGDKVETGDYTYYANLDLQYQPDGFYQNGLMMARDENGDYVFVDNAGELVFKIPPSYSIPYDASLNDGLLVVACNNSDDLSAFDVNLNNSYGYIDKTGELVISCSFASASNFKNGYAIVSKMTDTGEIIDPSNGLKLYNEKGNLIEDIFTPVNKVIYQYGVIDTSGNFVVDYQDYIINEQTTTFEQGIYEAYDPDTFISYCFNLKGQNLGELNPETNSCYSESTNPNNNTDVTTKLELPEGYRIGDFSEGVALVSSADSADMYFVDTDGNSLWTVDTANLIDIDEEYHEGLVSATIWDSETPYPGAKALANEEISVEEIVNNISMVLYDRHGKIVFKFRPGSHQSSLYTDTSEE